MCNCYNIETKDWVFKGKSKFTSFRMIDIVDGENFFPWVYESSQAFVLKIFFRSTCNRVLWPDQININFTVLNNSMTKLEF